MAKQNTNFKNRAIELGNAIWGVNSFEETLQELIRFIKLLKLPNKYSDFKNVNNIDEKIISELTEKVNRPSHLSKSVVKIVLAKIPK